MSQRSVSWTQPGGGVDVTDNRIKRNIADWMVMVIGLVASLLASVLTYLFFAGIQHSARRILIALLVFLIGLGATLTFHGKSRTWITRQSDKSLFRHSLVVILPLGLLAVITVVLGFIFTWSDRASRPIMFEASLAVLGGVGAAIALVVNYRRQKVLESETLTKRFSDFTNQLANDKPPVKLAGVYSLFRLADEWKEQRQQIIDVLCAYIRLPDPPRDQQGIRAGHEVRRTILRQMVRRMQKGGTFRDGEYNYDFIGVTFASSNLRSTNFSGVIFTGTADFSECSLYGRVNFRDATFKGKAVLSLSTCPH